MPAAPSSSAGPPGDAPVLVVCSGVHRAARCSIGRGVHRVGCSPDHDIVLSDFAVPADKVGATLFVIEHDGALRLRAAATVLDLARGRRIRPGQSHRARRDLDFQAGGIAFRLEAGADPVPCRRPSRVPSLTTLVGGAALAAGLVIVAAPQAAAPPLSHVSYEVTGTLPQIPRRTAVPTGSAAMLTELRRHLDEAGLVAIDVAAQADGSILAAGQIAPADLPAWHDANRWFDGASDGRVALVDTVKVSAAQSSPLAIQAVWTGRDPYVIDGAGEKLFIGSILPSGWTVTGIEASRVMLKRGGTRVAVRF